MTLKQYLKQAKKLRKCLAIQPAIDLFRFKRIDKEVRYLTGLIAKERVASARKVLEAKPAVAVVDDMTLVEQLNAIFLLDTLESRYWQNGRQGNE